MGAVASGNTDAEIAAGAADQPGAPGSAAELVARLVPGEPVTTGAAAGAVGLAAPRGAVNALGKGVCATLASTDAARPTAIPGGPAGAGVRAPPGWGLRAPTSTRTGRATRIRDGVQYSRTGPVIARRSW